MKRMMFWLLFGPTGIFIWIVVELFSLLESCIRFTIRFAVRAIQGN